MPRSHNLNRYKDMATLAEIAYAQGAVKWTHPNKGKVTSIRAKFNKYIYLLQQVAADHPYMCLTTTITEEGPLLTIERQQEQILDGVISEYDPESIDELRIQSSTSPGVVGVAKDEEEDPLIKARRLLEEESGGKSIV